MARGNATQKAQAMRMAVPGRDGRDVLATCRRCHNGRNNHVGATRGFVGTYHPAGLAPS